GRAGVRIRVLIAAVAFRDQRVEPPAAPPGRTIDHEKASVRLDLHPQVLVLDRGVAVGAEASRHALERHDADTDGAHTHGNAIDLDDRLALVWQGVPHHRGASLADDAPEQTIRECRPVLAPEREPRSPVDVVDRVEGAAAYRNVEVDVEESAPHHMEIGGRTAARKP